MSDALLTTKDLEPVPPQVVHMFVKDKVKWFPIDTKGPQSDEFSDLTTEEWHKKLELF